MRKPKQKILLDTRPETIDQYASFDDEEIFRNHDRYALAIGKFLIAFSDLERNLDSSLANAIEDRSDDPGYRIIKYLGFRNKTDLLRDCFNSFVRMCFKGRKSEKHLTGIKIIHDRLCELGEFRNKVAHAQWVTLDSDGYVRVKIEEDLKGEHQGGTYFKKTKMTPGIIVKFTRRCDALITRIDRYTEAVQEER